MRNIGSLIQFNHLLIGKKSRMHIFEIWSRASVRSIPERGRMEQSRSISSLKAEDFCEMFRIFRSKLSRPRGSLTNELPHRRPADSNRAELALQAAN